MSSVFEQIRDEEHEFQAYQQDAKDKSFKMH
jgi:hypothetical protein